MSSRISNKKNSVCTSVFESYIPTFIHAKEPPKTRNMKQRGISDIIATLLLLGITVAGAVLVTAFFQGNNLFGSVSGTTGSQTASLKITGYDTRDGPTISGITGFDNSNPTNSILTAGEYIVLNVQNQGINKVVLQSVEINDVTHSWDSTQGVLPSAYPAAGKFNIIPTTGTQPFTLRSTNELQRDDEVRLVIKLSSSLPDINLNEPIRVKFYTDLIDSSPVVITSGSVR